MSIPSVFHRAEQAPLAQFTRIARKPNMGGVGVDFMMGFREDGSSAIQSIDFDATNFSVAHAVTWLRERHSYRDGVQPAPEVKVPLSFEKITELVNDALRKVYPPIKKSNEEPSEWDRRYHSVKIWSDSVLVRKSGYCSLDTDPTWGLLTYSIDENAEPSVRLGEFEPMKLRVVAVQGDRSVDLDESIHLEEAGKRNAKADAQSINAAIRALANLLNDDDVDEDTLTAISAKRPAPKAEGNAADGGGVASANTGKSSDIPVMEGWAQLPGETFTETFAMQLIEGKFDKETMVLHNVAVLGPVSTNGRRYSVETQRDAIPLFEGIKAYLNHPQTRDMGEPRNVQDLIGEHKNVRVVGDRTISDLHLINNQTVREHVLPIVESKPHLAGNSIVARGKMVKADDGIMDVEKILAVRSVDLVAEPATTSGIFAEGKEYKETDMEWQAITLETLREKRADLVEVILASAKEKEHVVQLETQVVALQTQMQERDEKLAKLELTAIKNERVAEIARCIREAKLPDSAKYEDRDGQRVIKAHWLSMMERCQTAEEMTQLVVDWEASFKGSPTPISEHKDPLDSGPAGALSDAALTRLYRAAA